MIPKLEPPDSAFDPCFSSSERQRIEVRKPSLVSIGTRLAILPVLPAKAGEELKPLVPAFLAEIRLGIETTPRTELCSIDSLSIVQRCCVGCWVAAATRREQ